MIGSTFKRINVEEVRNLVVPMPPAEEQVEIARVLDRKLAKFEELTSEAEAAIGLLQERRSALISAAVTGKIDVRGLAPSRAEVTGSATKSLQKAFA
jgi:type I restriction enzyme S subunit